MRLATPFIVNFLRFFAQSRSQTEEYLANS